MIQIRKATQEDLNSIEQLYKDAVEYLETHVNYTGWKSGLYPVRADAEAALEEDAMYVATEDGQLIACFILLQEPVNGYEQADWGVELDYENINVIHTFAVHPTLQSRGIGQEIMRQVIELSRREGRAAIRFDTVAHNLPAIRLYEKCGFDYIATVDLGYHDWGLDEFRLYQMIL